MSGKVKILIQKLPKTKSGIQRYRVTKLINIIMQKYNIDNL